MTSTEFGQSGNRHRGGMNSKQALVWNLGTCRPDVKRETGAITIALGRVSKQGTGADRSVVVLTFL
ncbi:hypothetical protein KA005_82715 [bacterium]|nr:hypothetical protein [bacterium]